MTSRNEVRPVVSPHGGGSVTGITMALSFCLIANLATLMTFPAVLPEISREWHLRTSEAGWIGGAYFAGYAIAVPLLASATDRLDGRWIVAGSSLMGACASFVFAGLVGDFLLAFLARLVGGIALAGVHMPGLVLLTERITGPSQARSVSIYTSIYAVGSAGSFLVAGLADEAFGWRAVFLSAGLGPLTAIAVPVLLKAAPARPAIATARRSIGELVKNRSFMAYVIGFAGNTWEVFGIRVWFVSCLSWSTTISGNQLDLPNPALISGLASIAGVPASIALAECAERWDRRGIIIGTCLASVAVCLGLAMVVGGRIEFVLTLLVLLQITSFADVGSLGAGAIALAPPTQRGMAMAIYGFAGFASGFAGPAAAGLSLEWFGGAASHHGWAAAFVTLAAGSTITAVALWSTRGK